MNIRKVTLGYKVFNNENGQVAVIMAICLTILLGMAAFVIDVGILRENRRSLQTAADSAALAGVQELPDNTGSAVTIANQYVNLNFSGASPDISITENDTRINVTVTRSNIPLSFAKALAISPKPVSASAAASLWSPTSYKLKWPIGIMAKGSDETPYGFTFGQEVPLVFNSQNSTTGNYQFINLPSDSIVTIGSIIPPKPGQTESIVHDIEDSIEGDSCTFSDLKFKDDDVSSLLVGVGDHEQPEDCQRLVQVAIVVNPSENPGRYQWPTGASQDLKIVNFAYLFIPQDGLIHNGINAYFVRAIVDPSNAVDLGSFNPSGSVVYRLVN